MTMKGKLVQSATGENGNAVPPFDYAAAAAEVNKALDTIAELVPKFLAAEENSTMFVKLRKNTPIALIEKAIATAEQNQTLHPLFDVDDARDMLVFREHFRPVRDRLKAVERDLGFSLDARLMAVGRKARQFYAVAKSVVQHTTGVESLASHVDGMKATLPQTNRRFTPEKAAELAARKAERAREKALKAAEKAAAKAAKVGKGPKTTSPPLTAPPANDLPGPM